MTKELSQMIGCDRKVSHPSICDTVKQSKDTHDETWRREDIQMYVISVTTLQTEQTV